MSQSVTAVLVRSPCCYRVFISFSSAGVCSTKAGVSSVHTCAALHSNMCSVNPAWWTEDSRPVGVLPCPHHLPAGATGAVWSHVDPMKCCQGAHVWPVVWVSLQYICVNITFVTVCENILQNIKWHLQVQICPTHFPTPWIPVWDWAEQNTLCDTNAHMYVFSCQRASLTRLPVWCLCNVWSGGSFVSAQAPLACCNL